MHNIDPAIMFQAAIVLEVSLPLMSLRCSRLMSVDVAIGDRILSSVHTSVL